jgi:hypothetical protein
MSVDVLTMPATLGEPAVDLTKWIRRALLFTLLTVGGLLTLWVLYHLGPVAYGLPAPFFRRAALAQAA